MKIAYIVPSLIQQGPVIVAKDLVSQMVANGHECKVFYFDDKPAMEFECPVERISIKKAIRFTNFDIVHSHSLRPDYYVSRFREYSGSVKYITTLHNYVFQDLSCKRGWLVAQLMGRVWMNKVSKLDTIVTLSQDAEAYYKKIIKGHNNITYAYNSRVMNSSQKLNDVEQKELTDFKGDYRLIGVNGLLLKRKGIDCIIENLNKLPDYKLFIAGNGKWANILKDMANKCGVSDRCYFAGYKKDAYRYLPYYDIFAMPSRSEGFPLALLEAAYYGKKCVTSNLPIVLETFADEVEYFDLSDPKSIVQAIERAYENNELPQLIKHKFETHYSPQAMYRRYMEIYKS